MPATMPASLKSRFRIGGPNSTFPVPCGPLAEWFRVLRVSHIDYWSLDVEGAESLVLSTVDWSEITVGVLVSECSALGCRGSADNALHKYLAARGLKRAATLRARHDIWDTVYVNRSLLPLLASPPPAPPGA